MLDANAYRLLNVKMPLLKERFDNWLEQERVDISNCKSMEYQPGRLRCIVYDLDAEGKRYVAPGTGEAATRVVIYYPETEPPLGVFE